MTILVEKPELGITTFYVLLFFAFDMFFSTLSIFAALVLMS